MRADSTRRCAPARSPCAPHSSRGAPAQGCGTASLIGSHGHDAEPAALLTHLHSITYAAISWSPPCPIDRASVWPVRRRYAAARCKVNGAHVREKAIQSPLLLLAHGLGQLLTPAADTFLTRNQHSHHTHLNPLSPHRNWTSSSVLGCSHLSSTLFPSFTWGWRKSCRASS